MYAQESYGPKSPSNCWKNCIFNCKKKYFLPRTNGNIIEPKFSQICLFYAYVGKYYCLVLPSENTGLIWQLPIVSSAGFNLGPMISTPDQKGWQTAHLVATWLKLWLSFISCKDWTPPSSRQSTSGLRPPGGWRGTIIASTLFIALL